MANLTVKDAHSVHGTNPQYLIEKIIRTRIYECKYWKEECFALSAELLVDKAMELKYVGGIYGGNVQPTPFLCLVLKLLQIQPDKDIIVEFITNLDFKYVRALGAFYMRLTGSSLDCYKYLEPLYLDYRKLKRMDNQGEFSIVHMDEIIDEMLVEDRLFDVILPRIQKRHVMEENNMLEARVSALEEDLDDMDESDDDMDIVKDEKAPPAHQRGPGGYTDLDHPHRSPSPKYRRARSRSPRERRLREKEDRPRHRSRSRDKNRDRHRSRSRDRGSKRHDREGRKEESREGRKEESRRHHKSSKKSGKHSHHEKSRSSRKETKEDLEIREANELRAKLGMAPLR